MEFQRQLRAGRTIAQARRLPEDDDDDEDCGCGCCFRLGLTRGTAAALALAYALVDAAWCGFFAVGVLAAAWVTAVEADGTVRRVLLSFLSWFWFRVWFRVWFLALVLV